MNRIGTVEGGAGRVVFMLRAVHALFALYFIACLAYVYYAAFAHFHNGLLVLAMAFLALEGAVVILNRGQCPLTGIQRKAGDDKGFFNLFMPDALARAMVPFWFGLALVGFVLVWLAPVGFVLGWTWR